MLGIGLFVILNEQLDEVIAVNECEVGDRPFCLILCLSGETAGANEQTSIVLRVRPPTNFRTSGAPIWPLRCLTSTKMRGCVSPRPSGDAIMSLPLSPPSEEIFVLYPIARRMPATNSCMSFHDSFIILSLMSSREFTWALIKGSSASVSAIGTISDCGAGPGDSITL